MSDAGNGEAAADPGLSVLVTMLRFQGIGADPAQLRHRPSAGTTTTPSEPKGQELVYAARVSLDRTQMQVEGSRVSLSLSLSLLAWRSPQRSRLARAQSSPICFRRCLNIGRKACGSGEGWLSDQ